MVPKPNPLSKLTTGNWETVLPVAIYSVDTDRRIACNIYLSGSRSHSRTGFFHIKTMAEQNAEPVINNTESDYTTPANDPKNMQEVTQYVSEHFHCLHAVLNYSSIDIVKYFTGSFTALMHLRKSGSRHVLISILIF